jgi:cytidyltransferase-like protein
VLCSGAFDGLHAGHRWYLRAARGLLARHEPLCVAVAPDNYIRHVKGRDPYWTQQDRVDTIIGMRDVTQTFYQDELTPAALIREHQPRLFVKGADWAGKLPQDVIDACREVYCQIVYVDTPGRHVSEARG